MWLLSFLYACICVCEITLSPLALSFQKGWMKSQDPSFPVPSRVTRIAFFSSNAGRRLFTVKYLLLFICRSWKHINIYWLTFYTWKSLETIVPTTLSHFTTQPLWFVAFFYSTAPTTELIRKKVLPFCLKKRPCKYFECVHYNSFFHCVSAEWK